MSDLLDRAIAGVRDLPPEQQDEIASWIMQWTSDDASPVVLTAEEERSLEASLGQAARGEFASAEDIQALWAKYRL